MKVVGDMVGLVSREVDYVVGSECFCITEESERRERG